MLAGGHGPEAPGWRNAHAKVKVINTSDTYSPVSCSDKDETKIHENNCKDNKNNNTNINNNDIGNKCNNTNNNSSNNANSSNNIKANTKWNPSLLAALPTKSFLSSPENAMSSPDQLLAVPGVPHSRTRRLSSSSSCESLVSHSSRRRAKRNSEFDDDEGNKKVTLLSFARSTRDLCRRVGWVVGRNVTRRMSRSRRKQPTLVCEADIMEQTNWICTDYIINKLTTRDLMTRKVGLTHSHWPRSGDVINACAALECMYPKTYSNVSRKLSMTMSSTKLVRSTLASFLKVLFEGNITWAKVVSMVAVAGLFAEECSSQGHPDFVSDVLDSVLDFTGSNLLDWLVYQGGWDGFPVANENDCDRLCVFKLLGGAVFIGAITLTSSFYFDLPW